MPSVNPFVAIACGGTGGHLFPGLAVAQALQRRGCAIALMVSPKEVDQEGVKAATDMEVVTLPAIALQGGNWLGFIRGSWSSFGICSRRFKQRRLDAVVAMGGFTSAPPVLAGKCAGSPTFLHESNSIPGRANRWLARLVDEAFVGFPTAAPRLRHRSIKVVGTPVRPQIQPLEPSACRMALGLDPARPVLLVMGGSQGASRLNELLKQSLAELAARVPALQFLHLTGPNDREAVAAAYAEHKRRAVVFPFLTEMELALGAATVALSRSGASSLAEFAAMQVPSILVPFPSSADDHQFYNARAYAETGAARQLDQHAATPDKLISLILELVESTKAQADMKAALQRWHSPEAADQMAAAILNRINGGPRAALAQNEQAGGPSQLSPANQARSRRSREARASKSEIGNPRLEMEQSLLAGLFGVAQTLQSAVSPIANRRGFLRVVAIATLQGKHPAKQETGQAAPR